MVHSIFLLVSECFQWSCASHMQSAFRIQRIPYWHMSFLAGCQRLQGITASVGLFGYLGVTFAMIASSGVAGLRRSSRCPMCVCVCASTALVQTVRKRFRQRAMHPVSQNSTLNQFPS